MGQKMKGDMSYQFVVKVIDLNRINYFMSTFLGGRVNVDCKFDPEIIVECRKWTKNYCRIGTVCREPGYILVIRGTSGNLVYHPLFYL